MHAWPAAAEPCPQLQGGKEGEEGRRRARGKTKEREEQPAYITHGCTASAETSAPSARNGNGSNNNNNNNNNSKTPLPPFSFPSYICCGPSIAVQMVLINRFGVLVPPPTNNSNATNSRIKSAMSKITTSLDKDWSFKRASESADCFRAARAVPTEIFMDLLEHSLIPDPFLKKNELDVQWVGEEDWVYSVTFPSPRGGHSSKSELVFEGLDTYATVTLNGIEILKTNNMFTPYRVDVTEYLKEGSENKLEILFESAFLKGKKVKEQWPDFHWGCWNGDPSRLAVRKAQYHYVCSRIHYGPRRSIC
jgi:hypothetical protein